MFVKSRFHVCVGEEMEACEVHMSLRKAHFPHNHLHQKAQSVEWVRFVFEYRLYYLLGERP